MRQALLLLAFFAVTTYAKIDRRAVIERNNPVLTTVDTLGSLTVGNGHFATTVDITGLQTLPVAYRNGVPLCAMSDWGWHSYPNSESLTPEDSHRMVDLGHGHQEAYAVEYKTDGKNKHATEYFRVNPHRLNLGCVGFTLADRDIRIADITDIRQELKLYDGCIASNYRLIGNDVEVTTAAVPDASALLFSVRSRLLQSGTLRIRLSLPGVTGMHADDASDWDHPDSHHSAIVRQGEGYALIRHDLDATSYLIQMSWEGKAHLKTHGHQYVLCPETDVLNVKVEYAPDEDRLHTTFHYSEEQSASRRFWNSWWHRGGIVDFGLCTDPRAKELERRVVLSQYLTFINCANDTPPQETGLTYNSWFGRPHLEMTWWHMVDFSLWRRPEVMERVLQWYDTAYPYAKAIAERQGFKGIRWMKMTDPWVGEAPSNVGSFLTWQQPHYIYMAEEMYRHNPSLEVLRRYAHNVEQTAVFMADFARSCKRKDGKIMLSGQTAMQESMAKDFSYCHPFEQAYWVYGLTTAQTWRERMGMERNKEWDDIIKSMAPLDERDGIYTAGKRIDGAITPELFAEKSRSDHPAVLGACGMLPSYGLYDNAKMSNTINWVFSHWNWPTTWGWDYGMTAMCAARLGDGERAVQALLIDKGKNTYLISGHNFQEPKRLRLYLPGNGALLTAVAMMCAGWDGCPDIPNPGFPNDGTWNVQWEGLSPMQ